MGIQFIHTYLVYPQKGADKPHDIGGTEVPLEGKLFSLLSGLYENSQVQCDIDISFNPSTDGKQDNDFRNQIVKYGKAPSIDLGRPIAEALASCTDNRSGLGLLFLIKGMEGLSHRLVISRFPANSGISVEEAKDSLTVEFLERVFVRNAKTYKAAVFQDTSFSTGFWLGKAVDKQINSDLRITDYWVTDFLNAGLKTTPAFGTRRLASALREASKKTTSVTAKAAITSAATLAPGTLDGKTTSIVEFCGHFGLDDQVTELVTSSLSSTESAVEKFKFDAKVFSSNIAYRSVELDTGGILTAPANEFDEIFERSKLPGSLDRERFSTEGRIVDERFGKVK